MVLGAASASGLSAAMTTLFATSACAKGEQSISLTSASATPTATGLDTPRRVASTSNLVAIGNAPSGYPKRPWWAGGGTASYDVINIVGGRCSALVDNNLIEVVDTAQFAELGQG